jgi:hypothetical protein
VAIGLVNRPTVHSQNSSSELLNIIRR